MNDDNTAARVMLYADPTVCPACRGQIHGQQVCPTCRLMLRGPAVLDVWNRLIGIDQALALAPRQAPAAGRIDRPAAEPVGPPPATTPPITAKPVSSISAGTVILGLGALLLLVAAVIFVTVSWGSLHLLGRTAVLAGVTLAFAALATFATTRKLRGSAEALWAIVAGMLILDWFAAWYQGESLGLTRVALGPWAAGLALLMTAVTVWVAALARRSLGRSIVSLEVGTAVAALLGGLLLPFSLLDASWRVSWSVMAGTLLVVVITAIASRTRLKVLTGCGAVMTAFGLALSVLAGAAEALDGPKISQLVGHGHAAPLLLLAAISVAVGVVRPRLSDDASILPAAVATFLAVVAVEAELGDKAGVSVALAVMVALVAVSIVARGWSLGPQLVGGVLALVSMLVMIAVAGSSVGVALQGVDGEVTLRDRATPVGGDLMPWTASWWWVFVAAGVALALAAIVATRWPTATRMHAAWLPALLPMIVLGTGLGVLTLTQAPFWSFPAWLIGCAAACAALGWLGPNSLQVVAGLGAVAAAPFMTSDVLIGTTTLALVAAVLGVVAWRAVNPTVRLAAALGSASFVVAVVTRYLVSLDAHWRPACLAVVLASLVALAVAHLWFRRLPVARLAVESGVTGSLAVAVLLAHLNDDLPWAALLLALTGAGLLTLAAVVDDRRLYLVAGAGALFVGWVDILMSSHVRMVEAYTLPVAVIALAVGAWFLLTEPDTPSWLALGPGLFIGFAPSLPAALADPTSLRAGLLGLAAVLALGVGWWRRWQAPFVVGSAVAVLLAGINVWPYALAIQRWVLFAGLGAVFLGVGITWEDRVRQGRAAVHRVVDMR